MSRKRYTSADVLMRVLEEMGMMRYSNLSPKHCILYVDSSLYLSPHEAARISKPMQQNRTNNTERYVSQTSTRNKSSTAPVSNPGVRQVEYMYGIGSYSVRTSYLTQLAHHVKRKGGKPGLQNLETSRRRHAQVHHA